MKIRTITIFIIILFIGTLLRYHNLTVWPREGATFDEFAWTFQGLSILSTGTPTSWSPHRAYKNRKEYINPRGANFMLVTPYLEHPPLFGLIAGISARLNGVRTFDEVSIKNIRHLSLVLGIISIVAIYCFSSSLYGHTIGLIAMGIYSIVPTITIGSRLVQNENFFIPLFLSCLYLANEYVKTKNKQYLIGSAIIASIAPLAKMPWIAAPIAVICLFLYKKFYKEAIVITISTSIWITAWLIYGFSIDKEVFMNLWQLQLARYAMAFDSMFVLFRDPIITDRFLVDGWIYLGWAAMIWIMAKDMKQHAALVFGFLAYFAMFVFAIPSETLHGWYRYPFYPFLTVALAVFAHEHINKNYFVSAISFVVVGLSMLASSWERSLGFSYPVLRTYLASVAVGIMPAFVKGKRIEKFAQVINYGLIIICVLLSIWSILSYNEQ